MGCWKKFLLFNIYIFSVASLILLFKYLLKPAYLQWYNGSTSITWQCYVNKHNPDSSFSNFLKNYFFNKFYQSNKSTQFKNNTIKRQWKAAIFCPISPHFSFLFPWWILFKSFGYFFLYLHARPSANPTVYYRYWQCMQYMHVIQMELWPGQPFGTLFFWDGQFPQRRVLQFTNYMV